MDIGENIKKVRELKNLTQESLASALNMSQKSYSNLEKSGNNISFERILTIANYFEVAVTKILELNTELIFNNSNQVGGISQLNTATTNNYLSDRDLYEKLLAEKDKVIDLLEGKVSKN